MLWTKASGASPFGAAAGILRAGVVVHPDAESREYRQCEGKNLIGSNYHFPERATTPEAVKGGAVKEHAAQLGVRKLDAPEVAPLQADAGEMSRVEVRSGQHAIQEGSPLPGRHPEVGLVKLALDETYVLKEPRGGDETRHPAASKLDPYRGDVR